MARARADRDGVFWSLPTKYRPQADSSECSLGFGTAGVLLTLLELHQIEPAAETEEILIKGTDWLLAQLKKRGFHHGFYGGSAGVWYALDKLEHALPGIATEWRAVMLDQASSVSFGDTAAGLVGGAAGSLLGTLLVSEDDDLGSFEATLIQCLLAGTKLHPEGVFWDFNPTSLCPPIGFFQGNSGIDYALTAFRQARGRGAVNLLEASLHYTDSLFDPAHRNWLDHDASVAMRRLDQEALAKRILSGSFSPRAACAPPEDSISWSGGTCGLLLVRSYLRKCHDGDVIGEQADRDCARAVDRLARISDDELRQLDSTILLGLPGLILSLRECLPSLNESESASIVELINRGRALLANRPLEVEDEDLSLLTGITGHMHVALSDYEDASPIPLANPVTEGRLHPDASAEHGKALDLTPLLDRRLPMTKSAAKLASGDFDPMITLTAIREVTDSRLKGLSASQKRAVEYELGLHETLSQAGFQELFWRELECQMRFSRFYDDGMDDHLLTERFILSPMVKLLQLDFDPHAGSTAATESPQLIVRYRTSRGVFEVKVSELQFALLREFESEAWTVEAIANVIRRVDSAQVTQRQLADLAKHNIRAFAREGYVEAVKVPKTRRWWRNHSLRKIQQQLFHSGGA